MSEMGILATHSDVLKTSETYCRWQMISEMGVDKSQIGAKVYAFLVISHFSDVGEAFGGLLVREKKMDAAKKGKPLFKEPEKPFVPYLPD
jgi:hypothetical protein